MSISRSFNKNTGVTYVYDVYENYWDKEKKKYVQKRRLIGKIDPETGQIVPTRSRKKSPSVSGSSAPLESDYEALYHQAARELEQKNLEISLLTSRLEKLENELSSVLNGVIPALRRQADQLEQLVQE